MYFPSMHSNVDGNGSQIQLTIFPKWQKLHTLFFSRAYLGNLWGQSG